jgi:type II secretory pathway component PulF
LQNGGLMLRRFEASSEESWKRKLRVPTRELVVFTRQLVVLVQNGVPIVEALRGLRDLPESPDFAEVLDRVLHSISSGQSLSLALKAFPTVFPPVYATMVNIGEQTGALDSSLLSLSDWLEHDDSVRRKLMSALTYPVFVLALAMALGFALFYAIMPRFVEIFASLNAPLPVITRLLIWFTGLVRAPSTFVVAAIVFVLALHGWGVLRRQHWFRAALYTRLLQVPFLGGMLLSCSLSRYAASLSVTLEAGMPLTRALMLAARASESPLFEADAPLAREAIEQGSSLTEHMARQEIYPALLVQMVHSGEEASRLPTMLGRTASFCSLELESKIETFGAALEPLLLLGVSLVVGGVMLAIFIPLYSNLTQLGG